MFKKLELKPHDQSMFGTAFWSNLYKTVWPNLPETTDGFRLLYSTEIKMTLESHELSVLNKLTQFTLQIKTRHFTFTIIYHSFTIDIPTSKIKELAERGKDITFWKDTIHGRSVATQPIEFNVAYNSELVTADDIDADLMAIRLSLLPEAHAA